MERTHLENTITPDKVLDSLDGQADAIRRALADPTKSFQTMKEPHLLTPDWLDDALRYTSSTEMVLKKY